MQCENCGRPLRPQETICPNCGEPVWPDDAALPTLGARQGTRPGALRVGPPVDPYAPTIYGPQAPPRVYGDAYGDARRYDEYASSYPGAGAYPTPHGAHLDDSRRPLWPAPEAPRRARRRRGTALIPLLGIVAGLVVVVMLVGGALAASGQLNGLLGTMPGTNGQQQQQPPQAGVTTLPTHAPTATATAAPACPLKPVDKAAAAALKNVQLTSGLKDLQDKDLRPINNLKTFHTGQTLYVTFQFATNQAGTISADICTTGNRSDGSKDVPAGFINGRGEFSTPDQLIAPQDLGQGAVMLMWNGAVAAAVPFQVTNS